MKWISIKDERPITSRDMLFVDDLNNICYGRCNIWGKECWATDKLDDKSKKIKYFIELPLIPNHLEKNKYCKTCGELLNIYDPLSGEHVTLVGYPEDKNDNCKTRKYECKNGHSAILSIVNKNPLIKWRGQETCFCCLKVEEWPDPPKN